MLWMLPDVRYGFVVKINYVYLKMIFYYYILLLFENQFLIQGILSKFQSLVAKTQIIAGIVSLDILINTLLFFYGSFGVSNEQNRKI